MKILVITPFFYPHIGGSQQYMEDLYATLLKNHTDIKVHVLCYNTGHFKKEETYRGMRVYRINCFNILPGQFTLPNPIELIKFLTDHASQYDLIHCSTRFFESSWWAPIFAKMAGKKIILTDHCAFHPLAKNKLITFVAKVIDLTIVKYFLRLYDDIYATNKATQKFLKNAFEIKSKVIYGGVNIDTFYPEATPNRKSQDQNSRLKLLFVGRMIDSKGVKDLFEIIKAIDGIETIFVGPGPLQKELKEDIEKDNLHYIKILGPQNKKAIAKLMRKADILVHPSYHHEGFPNVLLEAGASKLATISTNVGGSGEIIINQKTGILVKPRDQVILRHSLLKLIANKKSRSTLSQNLYTHILANFTWENAAEKQYKELLKIIS